MFRVREDGVKIYDSESFKYLQESGYIAKTILLELIKFSTEGTSLLDIDIKAFELCKKHKVMPAFLNYNNYKYSTCLSNNDVVVHGLPNNLKLKNGDILSIDFGCIYKDHYSDNARTICIGNTESKYNELINLGEKAFNNAIQFAIPGNRTGDISFEINKTVLSILQEPDDITKNSKYKIFYGFQGHGIGMNLHELPPIPNLGLKDKGEILEEGMCFCIEPVIIYRSSGIIKEDNDFIQVYKTDNSLPSSHFEDQVFITKDGPKILTKINS